MRPASIRLRIDELILEGVALTERHHITDALERELGGLLAQPAPWPEHSRAVDIMNCGTARVTERGGLGTGVAQSIYRALVTPAKGARA